MSEVTLTAAQFGAFVDHYLAGFEIEDSDHVTLSGHAGGNVELRVFTAANVEVDSLEVNPKGEA